MLLMHLDDADLALLRNAVRIADILVFIRHICQDPGLDKLDLPQDTTGNLLAAFARKIQQDGSNILLDSLHVFSLLARTNEGRQAVIDAGIVPYLIQFLGHNDTGLKIVALRVSGQITAGTNEQTQVVLDNDALTQFHTLLRYGKERIKKEAIWCLSNITAGTETQIQLVIDAGLIPVVIKASQEGEFHIQVESTWAICNLTIHGSESQVVYTVKCGAIPIFCNLLHYRHQAIRCVFQGLNNLLKKAGKDMVQ